ncbi:hypothetical protein HMI48_01480 [Acidithiobacillus ferrooxidans]|uniref:PD-(D/E)XK nuclease family protein n=1 Tax=Acidithiobacillus ferrooxidans TaxID=920 RepID=UPI001C065CFA|nr:PD-(D/E)XK nuclease family protein [Acidithiobacillus ferrooxidans]MBU2772631.1 hypothetical protein [Acidithiobacillus ferrooxidans]
MSNDFYSRLFTYRARPNREPLEDFLTELFCELLNLFADSKQGQVIGKLLNLQNLNCDWNKVSWRTQFPIEKGRCDLIGKTSVKTKDSVFILIENKISAGFTGSAGGEEQHQLRRYDEYLKSRFEENAVLILISLYSFPPPGMVKELNMVSWRTIASRLGEIASQLKGGNPLLASQLNWFLYFLRSNHMSEVKISLQDIASTSAWKRLENSCEAIGGEVARQVLGGTKGLQEKLNDCGIVQPNGYGDLGKRGNFNGIIFTPENKLKPKLGIKANAANLVIWFGVLLDKTYDVPLTITDVPEFSAAVCMWIAKEEMDEEDSAITKVFDALQGKGDWSQHIYPGYDGLSVYAIRKAKPLTTVYDENIDWLDYARTFYEGAVKDLSLVDVDTWENLVEFAQKEDGEETEAIEHA